MIPLLAAFDYSVFPPINAALNGLSTVLLLTGVCLIKAGRRRAHQYTMIGALASSAVFLACYLTYHYGAGHTEFPKEYPVARMVYLAILVPHIVLAVVNLPFILLLVTAAARGNFERHKRLARFTFPSWLFVSVTGVVIYLMIYQWFPATETKAGGGPASARRVPLPEGVDVPSALASVKAPVAADGNLVFSPLSQTVRAEPGQETLEVFFKVENTASVPLRIASLESGCACLEVSIDANPVPAKGTATIKGVFEIAKLRGSADRSIMATPEGRSRPVFLTTKIEIAPVYEIEPTMTTWRKGDDAVTKSVEFRVAREEPVHVLSAESKRPEVRCQLVEVEKGRRYRIDLTPESTQSSLLGIVRLETDCELENYARPLLYFSIQ